MKILVIGLPGTGKTTYCRDHLQDGLCYDLDAISQAFRLGLDDTEESRDMANEFLTGFSEYAEAYSGRVFIIRTAPSMSEFMCINPDMVVICTKAYVQRECDDMERKISNINKVITYCNRNDIPYSVNPRA